MLTKRKCLLITILLYTSTFGFGQDLPTTTTSEHIHIEGTKVFMIPPDSFKFSPNFKGFQAPDDQTSMIMIIDMPGPYSEIAKGFNADMLKTQGMVLKNKHEIRVADFDGMLIELSHTANGTAYSKHILVYGNEKSTTIINGIYLKDSLELGRKIKASILSTYVDVNSAVDARKALNYSLDETAGGLRFESVINNGMIFSGKLDKTSLITDKSYAKIQIENKKRFCLSRLKKYPHPYSLILNKGIQEIELDGLKGYALFATPDTDANEVFYQVILFEDDGGYYILGGTYPKDNDKALIDLQNVIKTFQRKL